MRADVARPVWMADYLRVRELEGRLYPDDIVRALPRIPHGHPLEREWRQRADSAARLLGHLSAKRPTRLLDIGSGNGWLTAAIARALPDAAVTGMELNDLERTQAIRVFADQPNLGFGAGDVTTSPAPAARPETIVLASVIQYVPDLPAPPAPSARLARRRPARRDPHPRQPALRGGRHSGGARADPATLRGDRRARDGRRVSPPCVGSA